MLFVDRDPRPVRPADVPGEVDRALQRGRREDPVGPQRGDPLAAFVATRGGDTEGVARGQTLGHEPEDGERERLRQPRLLGGDIRLRHRPLLHGEKRRAGAPIEHEDVAHLGRDGERRHVSAVPPQREHHRLGGNVVVPQVVVHHLEVPEDGAGRRPQRDHGIRVEILSQSPAAEEVGTGAAHRHEHHVGGGIGGDDTPGVGGAGLVRPASPPGVVAGGGRIPGNRIPAPS